MITKLLIAGALLLSTTVLGLAQSQPNYGASGPGRGDCYGSPYSGSAAARCDYRGYRSYR